MRQEANHQLLAINASPPKLRVATKSLSSIGSLEETVFCVKAGEHKRRHGQSGVNLFRQSTIMANLVSMVIESR